MINWTTKKRIRQELADTQRKNTELILSLTERNLKIKQLEMKNEQMNKICNTELEFNRKLFSKLNKATSKHEKATLLINTHLKSLGRLQADYSLLNYYFSLLKNENKTVETEKAELYEELERTRDELAEVKASQPNELAIFEQLESKDKEIEYLKTTLKNNLILFEHYEHKHYILDRNKYLFNPFPFNKWEIAMKHAIEQRLQEVQDESETTRQKTKRTNDQ